LAGTSLGVMRNTGGHLLKRPGVFRPLRRGDEYVVSLTPTVKTVLASIASAVLVMCGLAVPVASAEQCTASATLLDGTTLTFKVNVPPGTPPIEMLPPGTQSVQSVTANCLVTTVTPAPPSETTAPTKSKQRPTTISAIHTKTTTGTHTKTTVETHSSSATSTTKDHGTGTARSRPAHSTGSHGDKAEPSKKTTRARSATEAKRHRHSADPTRRSARRPNRVARRTPESDRPSPRSVVTLGVKPEGTAGAVEAAFKTAALSPAHQPGSVSILWVVLAALMLICTGFGAAKELGIIRRRL